MWLIIGTSLRVHYAYTSFTRSGIASTYPEPKDKEAFISAQLYDYIYKNALPSVYSWPDM